MHLESGNEDKRYCGLPNKVMIVKQVSDNRSFDHPPGEV